MRRLPALLLLMAVFVVMVAAIGYRSATAMPVVRRATVALTDWPAGAAPVTIALVSDIHIGNLATDRARFVRIADAVSALHPDLIVLAGDFIAGHGAADGEAAPELVEGLRRLHAPLGVVAVPGNHDHWTSIRRVRAALAAGGVTLLANRAVRRGPLAIGGVDDMVTQHASLARTWPAMVALGGAKVLVSHSPDIAPQLTVGGLILAGHTHCGQIVLPWYGPLVEVSLFGARYRCGVARERGRTTIVGAGVGTSVVPLRYGAPSDVWLVRVGRQADRHAAVSP